MGSVNKRIFDILGSKHGVQKELASFVGVSDRNVNAWKSRGSAIDAEYIPAIADFLKVSIDYLLTGKEENKNKFFLEDEIALIMAYRNLNAEVKKFVFNSVIAQGNNKEMPLVAPDEAILRAASGLDNKENKETIA